MRGQDSCFKLKFCVVKCNIGLSLSHFRFLKKYDLKKKIELKKRHMEKQEQRDTCWGDDEIYQIECDQFLNIDI